MPLRKPPRSYRTDATHIIYMPVAIGTLILGGMFGGLGVMLVYLGAKGNSEFVLFGQPFVAMSAGPLDPFNHAISFVVNCEDQAELDRYWNALLEGGSAEQCGWLKDRFGLSWQIVPSVLGEMMAGPDRAKAKRASDAMMKMVKFDIAALQAAFAGSARA